jgi:hypothetical protein
MIKKNFCANLLFVASALCAGLMTMLPAQAALVTTTVNGTVSLADSSNPFGLEIGDTVTAVTTYDNAGISAVGDDSIEIDSNPSFSLTITLGSFTYTETDDDTFGSGFPLLQFLDGALMGIDFRHTEFSFGQFPNLHVGSFTPTNSTIHSNFFLDEHDQSNIFVNILLEGSWDFANALTVPVNTAVPEPGTWLLLSAGFIGLLGFNGFDKRRKHRV